MLNSFTFNHLCYPQLKHVTQPPFLTLRDEPLPHKPDVSTPYSVPKLPSSYTSCTLRKPTVLSTQNTVYPLSVDRALHHSQLRPVLYSI